MSSYAKSFVLTHTFKYISSLNENENRYSNVERRYNTPWKLGISRKNGMLAVYLHCNKEFSMHRKWSIQTKYTMKLVAASGKYVQRTKNHEFQERIGFGFPEFISWENMQRDYVNNDSILIEAHANIINMTDTPTWQPNIGKSFVLKHTFTNISKFVDNEDAWSDIEEHYNIPWRLKIFKFGEVFWICLICEKAVCEERKYEIKCEFEIQLISSSGKCHAERLSDVFDKPNVYGMRLISWEDLKKDYVDNDSFNVEIIVNIIDIKESSCIMSNKGKNFVLSYAVENISSIKEGGNYSTGIENRFNIPWKLQIQRQGGFVLLFLHCEKEQSEYRKWTVETEIQLKLVSTNGNNISSPVCYIFNNEEKCRSWREVLTWRYMEDKLVVNDSVIIEAHVKILNITGIENKGEPEKPSGIVIPVGNKYYSMEEWMKMAFDQ